MGLSAGSGVMGKLEWLVKELLRWNRVHNLTGHRDFMRAWVDLVLDSLQLVEYVQGPGVLDIGTGAGFPGMVLAVARQELEVVLLEPRAKRVSFLKHAWRELGLGQRVKVVCGRAGEGVLEGERFPTVTARAVGDLGSSLELAMGYVAPGGVVLLPRGIKDKELAEQMGLEVVEYELPAPVGGRRIVAIKRVEG